MTFPEIGMSLRKTEISEQFLDNNPCGTFLSLDRPGSVHGFCPFWVSIWYFIILRKLRQCSCFCLASASGVMAYVSLVEVFQEGKASFKDAFDIMAKEHVENEGMISPTWFGVQFGPDPKRSDQNSGQTVYDRENSKIHGRIPTVKFGNSGKIIFEIRIPNFCYIQVIVFDLSPNRCHW